MLSAVPRSLVTNGARILRTTVAATTVLATAAVLPPTVVDPGICNTVTLAAGGGSLNPFSLAISQSDGSVWAWGTNDHGQLGNNSTANSSTPVQVKLTPNQPLTGIISVSGGAQFALALDSNGSVFAWGDNSTGQLGVPNVTESHVATEPLAGSQGPFVAISAGSAHALALDRNGSVWVWGSNLEGQLGIGTTGGSFSAPRKLQSPSGIVAISAGDVYSLALDNTGHVWAWGFNGTGELGDGTQTSHPTPTPASILGATAISAGSLFAMARKADGSLWAWGDDQFGELGNGVFAAPFASQYFTPAAVQFNFGAPVAMDSAGSGYALAVTGTPGATTLWAWGANTDGFLGTGDTTNLATPTPLSGMSDVTAVSAGGHSLALHANGTASKWGAGILTPQPVTGLPTVLQPVPPCGPSGTGGGPIGTSAPELSLTVVAPSALTWIDSSNYGQPGNYSPNPVPVTATIQNVGNAPAESVKLTISLEAGLSLVSGEGPLFSWDSLAPGASQTVEWHLQVPFFPPDRTYIYTVTASATNALSVVKSGTIVVPKVPRRIVFVHGLGSSFAQLARSGCDPATPFLNTLRDQYGDGKVVVFRYYQDAGYQTLPPVTTSMASCVPQSVTKCQSFPGPDQTVGHLFSTQSRATNICDSGSDLAYNAAMLDDLLATYPGPQTIIGYSEGGAITRGWLVLDLIDRPNSLARKTVDSVIFIQAPQGGSWLARDFPRLVAETAGLIPAGMTIEDLARQYFGITSLTRPGVVDVIPESDWYRSVNFYGDILPGIHYYNFYTDIKLTITGQWFFDVFKPYPQDIGDGVVQPYDLKTATGAAAGDLPFLFMTDDIGNSRFLPGFAVSRGQFQFSHYESMTFNLTNPTFSFNTVLNMILADPYSHAGFLPNYTTDVDHGLPGAFVQSCIRGQGPVLLIVKIEQIINDPANACNP